MFLKAEGRKVVISYKRKKDFKHILTGEIVKVRKSSLKLLIGGESTVTIGFRNIHFSLFLDSCNRIKYKLYYEKHNI